MGVSLTEQARSLLCSLALGLAAALLYDLLRALRLHRRSRTFTALLDALYCLALAALFFAFALSVGGGELRLYTLFAALAGAAAYFVLLAPVLRPLWRFWADTLFALLRLLRLPFDALKIFYGKLAKLCKRLFLFSRGCIIIKSYQRSARRAYRRSGQKRGRAHGQQEETAHQCARAYPGRRAADHRHHPADHHAPADRGGSSRGSRS